MLGHVACEGVDAIDDLIEKRFRIHIACMLHDLHQPLEPEHLFFGIHGLNNAVRVKYNFVPRLELNICFLIIRIVQNSQGKAVTFRLHQDGFTGFCHVMDRLGLPGTAQRQDLLFDIQTGKQEGHKHTASDVLFQALVGLDHDVAH